MRVVVGVSSWARTRAAVHFRTVLAGSSVALLTAGTLVMGAGSAMAASGGELFAYPDGGAVSPTSCPRTATTSDQCTLAQALGLARPGDAVELAAVGPYVGNFTLDTAGTSPSARVAIEPASGVTGPILDGNKGAAAGCRTTACDGPVLTIGGGVSAALSGISIRNADNTTTGRGGGIYMANGADLTVTGSTFAHNIADDGRVFGNGGAIDSGDGGSGTLSVQDSTFTGNSARDDGGAIDTADGGSGTAAVTDSVFTGNTAAEGGAIDNADQGNGTVDGVDGTLTVSGSTFANNTTTGAGEGGGGGAIDSGDHPGSPSGTAKVTVRDSTFAGNDSGSSGGAIDIGGPTALSVTTSTFSANTAAFFGGAVEAAGSGAAVTASTFAGNSAAVQGDAIGAFGPVAVAADEFADACSRSGTWTDGGYNVGDASCFGASPGAGDQAGSGLAGELGSLADNGGPTRTILLRAGNPGIALVPNGTGALCPTVDQRGVTSPAGGRCNAGAVQQAGTTTAVTSSVNPSTSGQPVRFTATVAAEGPATGTPTGTVQFTIDGAPQGGAVTLTNGTASVTDSALSVGSHHVSATYSGGAGFASSASPSVTQVVDAAPTTTLLTVPAGPVAFGAAVDLHATVAARSPGSGTPTGVVQFFVDGHPAGGPITLHNGRASTTTTIRLAAGGHTVTADYRGSADYSGSSDSKRITIAKQTAPTSAPSSSPAAAPTTTPAAPTASSAAAPTSAAAPATTSTARPTSTAPASPAPPTSQRAIENLASTGTDVSGPVWFAMTLFAAGLGLIAASRRRRHSRHTH